MGETTTYSFKDLNGSIVHSLLGAYEFNGAGVGSVHVAMATEKTNHKVASDGSVMVSYMAGNNGTIAVVCQQTSRLHKYLMAGFNALKNAAEQGNVGAWASMSMLLRNTATGTSHMATGVSFQKMADQPYEAQGSDVTWNLMAANIESMTA
jgi:hypothetical protein